jgi:uncharacterized damage-inducible protein DinB
MSASTLLHSLFRQKAWINAQFFEQLAAMDAAQHADTLHQMLRTLNHIHTVDRIFRGHLSGEPHGQSATNTPETPTVAQLRDAVAALDGWYVDYTQALSQSQLDERLAFTFTDGDKGLMSREEILAHVITHGAYHRGEVGRLLKGVSLVPPRDLFTKFLHEAEPARRG